MPAPVRTRMRSPGARTSAGSAAGSSRSTSRRLAGPPEGVKRPARRQDARDTTDAVASTRVSARRRGMRYGIVRCEALLYTGKRSVEHGDNGGRDPVLIQVLARCGQGPSIERIAPL